MNRIISAITLIELLIAMVLLALIVLGIGQVDFFSSFHLINASRRTKINNEVSMALEHMSKQIAGAIGNELINGADTVVDVSGKISGDDAIQVYIDANGNGQRDPVGTDRWIAYRFTDGHGNPSNRYQIWYCPNCKNNPCNNCTPAWGTDANNIIARNISGFNPSKPSSPLQQNYVTIQLRACWDPTTAETRDNPCVNMNTRIKMPSVSTN